MKSYRIVWFDLGLTLVHTNRAAKYKKMLMEHGIFIEEEEIERAYHLTDKDFMRMYPGQLGKNPAMVRPWYFGVLNYRLGVELDLLALCREMKIMDKRQWKAYEFTIPTLKWLRDNGYEVGLISNWDRSCREVLAENGIDCYLNYIVVSSEVGVEKPSSRIFEIGLNLAGAKGSECLYVGDNYYDDVKGASSVGMDCYLLNPEGRVGIEELRYDKVITDISQLLKLKEFERT